MIARSLPALLSLFILAAPAVAETETVTTLPPALLGPEPIGVLPAPRPLDMVTPATLPQTPAVDAERTGLPPAATDRPVSSPNDFVARANAAGFMVDSRRNDAPDPFVAKLQILLDRAGASPGVIDGYNGDNVTKAIAAVETMHGLPADGVLDAEVWEILDADAMSPVFADYVLTAEDVAGPFVPDMPRDYGEMAKLESLAYRDPAERLAEKFHMDEKLLRRLNPGAAFEAAGASVVVADPGANTKAKVAHLVADKARRQLLGYDAKGSLVVAYPATIGSADLPSPTGVHAIGAIADNAEYWYRPDVNFVQGENRKALRLAPGPNNPIGLVWIGLDKPTYGIHGAPEPSKIGKTNSHGCVRLTNWDVKELVRLVAPGVMVDFLDTVAVSAAQSETMSMESGPTGAVAPR